MLFSSKKALVNNILGRNSGDPVPGFQAKILRGLHYKNKARNNICKHDLQILELYLHVRQLYNKSNKGINSHYYYN